MQKLFNNNKTVLLPLYLCIVLAGFTHKVLCITGTSYTANTNRDNRAERTPFVSIFGDQVIADRVDYIDMLFQNGLPKQAITATSGTGSVNASDSCAVISSGTDATATATLQSAFTTHYRPGYEINVYFTAMFTGGSTANSEQWIGLFDSEDGTAVGYNDTNFSVLLRRNGSNTIVAQSHFNIDPLDGTGPSGITLDPSKLNIYRVTYGLLDAAPIHFQMVSPEGNWIDFHTIKWPNEHTTPTTLSPSLPFTIEVNKHGSDSTDLTIKSASIHASVLGGRFNKSERTVFTKAQEDVSVGTSFEPLLTIKNKTNFQNKTNKSEVTIIYGGFSTRGTTLSRFHILKNAVLTGDIFVDRESNYSTVQTDTSATTYNGGELIYALSLGNLSHQGVFFSANDFIITLTPGETLTVIARRDGIGFSNMDTVLTWEETM